MKALRKTRVPKKALLQRAEQATWPPWEPMQQHPLIRQDGKMWEETLVLLDVTCTVCSLTARGNPEVVTSLKSCQKHPPPKKKYLVLPRKCDTPTEIL